MSQDLSFPVSAGSTADSPEPDSGIGSSPSPTRGDAPSSPPDSPESRSLTTFIKSQKAHDPEDCERLEEADRTNTLSARDGTAASTVVMNRSLPTDSRIAEEIAPTLQAANSETRGGTAGPLIFSLEDSPAPMSPSPGNVSDSPELARASSTSSRESQVSLFAPADTFSLRTSRVFSVPTADGTSLPSSGQWPTSGFMISLG